LKLHDAGVGRRAGYGLVVLLGAAACTEPNAPDASSPLGGWGYSFTASALVAGQEIKCYETGSVNFVREAGNAISGFSGVVHSGCIPSGILVERSGRVPVEDASISETSVAYRAESCVFAASTPSPATGGPPTKGEGFVTCRQELAGSGDSVTVAGPLVLSR
jgi:hypothetical protein